MLSDFLTQLAIDLVERGLVPDRLTRLAIRRLCAQRLVADPRERAAEFQRFLASTLTAPVAPVPEAANEQHYEVPAEMFRYILGRHRKYSCCHWESGVRDLDQAEESALRLTCERAELDEGQSILELGCGWGSLSLWIAEHYPTARLTSVSNSASQREYILSEARRRGIERNLTVITADMNQFQPAARFDRVVSVEMFEHMRNYGELLKRIANWLTVDGKLFVHIFCHRELAYAFDDRGASDWMGRYFFTGGIMPSEDLFSHFPEHLQVTKQWRWQGDHYRQTAEAWVRRMDENRDALLPILRSVYGNRQAERWFQRWRLLFLAGAELFGYDGGNQWFVAHYLMAPVMLHRPSPKTAATPHPAEKWECAR